MKRFIKLTCGGGDKVWVDIDSVSAISEYVVKSDPNIKSLVWLKDGNGGWRVRETPKEVFEIIRAVE
jgi:hypothetical protein